MKALPLVLVPALALLPLTASAQRFGPLPANTMRAHFINVGQGDATLLEFACGTVLIDAGAENATTEQALLDYISDVFQARADLNNTINSIVITHNHIDHTRALQAVVETFTVNNVVENGQRANPDRTTTGEGDVNFVRREHPDIWTQIDDAQIVDDAGLWLPEIDAVDNACNNGVDPWLTVLSADLAEDPGWGDSRGEPEFNDKNNHSIVVRVDFDEASFLFTGDLEEPAIETMLLFYENTDLLDVDVYQVGHHGSHNGTTMELLQTIDHPELAVVSMGRCDFPRQGPFNAFAFGHPREIVIDLLQGVVDGERTVARTVNVAEGVRDFHQETMDEAVYGTGWDGNVTVVAHSNGNDYEVIVDTPAVPTC